MCQRAAPRAAPARAADLRFRAGPIVSADDERCRPHGVEAKGGLAVRRVREAPGPRNPPVLARPPSPTPHPAAEPGHVGVPDCRKPRGLRHTCGNRGDFKARKRKHATAERRRKRKAATAKRAARRKQAAAERRARERARKQSAKGRPRSSRPRGDSSRARNVRQPRLSQVRVQGLLARHGRLPRPARWRLTCT